MEEKKTGKASAGETGGKSSAKPEKTTLKSAKEEQTVGLSVSDSIKLARDSSKPRKFEQTWDFIINLKGIDLKKPENRFNAEFILPKGRGKKPKVAVFADATADEAKKHADLVISKKEMEQLAGNKKKLKSISDGYDFFFAEAPLMPAIGKTLGIVLGPRGKMPKPMPPKGNIEPLLGSTSRMVRIALKETPVIYVVVGSGKMGEEDIAENVRAVFNFVKEKLPKGMNNIRSTLIKLTMGKPVKITLK